ncbi:DUF6314 family protein [Granulicella sp. S190]|uniref:DUF6314 family protein n=1 Tax=Granulicella sp. S190 TaxID=1747226 RepID=UPI00131AB25D|nr:DUF6314 family protein [Granulicella sp. S190]
MRDVFDGLLGEWGFEREIPGQGRMSGTASFTALEDGSVLYREAGELRLEDGQALQSRQSYLYERGDCGFAVRFHDTRELFQVVRFEVEGEEMAGGAEHLCKDDRYVSAYRIYADGSFEIRHRVSGPKKDYAIRTVYWRLKRESGASC